MSPGKAIDGMSGRGYSSLLLQASSKVDLKIFAITLRASTLMLERVEIGEAGCGDRRSAIKSRASAMFKSIDKDIVVCSLVGNHTTVLEMRSPCVSEM